MSLQSSAEYYAITMITAFSHTDLRLLICATRLSLHSPCGNDDEEATSADIPSVLGLAAAFDAFLDLVGGGGGGGGSLDTFQVGIQ